MKESIKARRLRNWKARQIAEGDKVLTKTDDVPITIVKAAPTPAPEDTPSKSGEINLF